MHYGKIFAYAFLSTTQTTQKTHTKQNNVLARSKMSIFDNLQLIILCGQEIDASWNFFVSVHMAIFGTLLISRKIQLITFFQKIILYSSYLCFTLINIRSKVNSYEMYSSLFTDIKNCDFEKNVQIKNFIMNADFGDRVMISVIVHVGALVIFSALLFYKKRSFNEKQK